MDAAATLELILKLRSEGRFEEADAALEQLRRKAEEISEEGARAGEALEKLGTAGAATNTGKGLASDPAKFFAEMEAAQAKNIQLTKEQIAFAEQYEQRLKNVVTALRLKGQSHEQESAQLARVTAALAPHRAEQERQKKVLEELKNAQADETVETDKATTAKEKYRDLIRGLSAEFPHLAQVLRIVMSEEAVLTAGVVMAIRAFGEYAEIMHEARDSSNALAGSSAELGESLLRALDIRERAREAARSIAEIAKSYDTVSEAHRRWLEQFLLEERFQNKLGDDALRNRLKEIATDKTLTPAQKLEAEFEANQQAAARKRSSEEESLRFQSSAAYMAAANAQLQRDAAEGKLPGLSGEVARRKTLADKAAEDAAKAQKEGEPEVADMRKMLALMERMRTGKFDSVDLAQYGALEAGGKTGQELEAIFREKLEFWEQHIASAKALAKLEADRLKAAEQEYDDAKAARDAAERDRKKFHDTATAKEQELNKTIEFNRTTAPRDAEADRGVLRQKVEREEELDREAARTYRDRVRRWNEHGGEGEPPEKPARIRDKSDVEIERLLRPVSAAGSEVIDAIQGVVQANTEQFNAMRDLILELSNQVRQQNTVIADLRAVVQSNSVPV